jgi:hypothetical protein
MNVGICPITNAGNLWASENKRNAKHPLELFLR